MNPFKNFLKGLLKGIGFKFKKPEKKDAGETGEIIGKSLIKLTKSIFILFKQSIVKLRERNKKKREAYALSEKENRTIVNKQPEKISSTIIINNDRR